MAGKRQPIDLITAKGKMHIGKDEVERRKNLEVKAFNDNVKAPDYLPIELEKQFYELANELLRINIMSNLDSDVLAMFIISRKMYQDLTNKILKESELLCDPKVLSNQDKLFKQCRAAAGDLGLTIAARCKLVVPNAQPPKEENKFAEFIG